MVIGTAPGQVGDGESPRLLITVEAAAELLSISRTRMYALIKAGEVMSVRVGRLRRIPVGALDAFMTRLLTDQHAA
jgi:excisionase family DNA binding protein